MPYERLFQKGRIGNLTIRNRAVMTAMATDFAMPDGAASMRLIRYYQERAKGGIGLIINEYTGVDHVTSIPALFHLRASSDVHVAGLEILVDAVHACGARIFAQLHHAGSTSKAALTGRQALSASDVLRALARRRSVVYTPWFWRPVMAVLRALPAPVFRRLPI